MPRGFPDYWGMKAGVYDQLLWAAYEGVDKNFEADEVDQGYLDAATISYSVPDGKTLYLVGASFGIQPSVALDHEHILVFRGHVNPTAGAGQNFWTGGIGGGIIQFTKPVVIAQNTGLNVNCVNVTNITCDLMVSAWGYEI